MIRCYAVPESLFILGNFQHFYTSAQKNENFKKYKKHLEISSFNISVPKIMIICYITPETGFSLRPAQSHLCKADTQADQFASVIGGAGNITNVTGNRAGKSFFFLKTQKRLVLTFLCL